MKKFDNEQLKEAFENELINHIRNLKKDYVMRDRGFGDIVYDLYERAAIFDRIDLCCVVLISLYL